MVWIMLLHTETSAVPVGYFASREDCVMASKEAVMVIDGSVTVGGQLFTCVPVQGLLTK